MIKYLENKINYKEFGDYDKTIYFLENPLEIQEDEEKEYYLTFTHLVNMKNNELQDKFKGTGVGVAYVLNSHLIGIQYGYTKPIELMGKYQEERIWIRGYKIYFRNFNRDIQKDRRNNVKNILNSL